MIVRSARSAFIGTVIGAGDGAVSETKTVNRARLLRSVAALALVACVLSGCGRWSKAALERRTAERIDAHLEIGMSKADFDELHPLAEFWREQDGREQYVVTIHKRCFWCASRKGFQASREYYVRVAQFENDRLVSVDPVELRR